MLKAANPDLKGTPAKIFFWGRNYRKEWTTPVSAPVFHLQSDFSNLKSLKEGGGKQTHSLHLEDQSGNKWALRSLRKFPEKAITPELKGTVAGKILSDAISASYPYGALAVGTLSNAAQIPYMENKLVYLEDDSSLRKFKTSYAHELYLLEKGSSEKLDNDSKELDTQELIAELQKDNDNKVDQLALLRVRILDNFIMDFDRHEDQWSWIKKDIDNLHLYYPIPKDRDQAFFYMNGFFPSLLKNMQFFNQFQGLRAKTKKIATFNFAPRNLDRTFLTELPKKTWEAEADRFIAAMTDSVIEAALHKTPPETHQLSTQKIIETLKDKRKYFKHDLMEYYASLAQSVAITGSNENEQFNINKNPDGTLLVQVYKMDSTNNPGLLIYQRLFDPKETKEVQLYGLEGDDKFVLNGGESKIKIRLVGGPGKDSFINEGNGGKAYAYDVKFEENSITENKGIKNKFSTDPLTNEYRRLGFQYDGSSPGLNFEYADDGSFFIGPDYKILKHGFKKDPYASKQIFSARKALNASSYQFKYDADFTRFIKNEDLLIRADIKLPTGRTRFYGFGNNTVTDDTKNNETYYLSRYILGNLAVMARHTVNSWLQIKYGPEIQFIKLLDEKNKDHYIHSIYPVTTDEKNIYNSKWYAGGAISAAINTKNSEVFPTRGIEFTAYANRLKNLSGSNSLTQMNGHFSFYTDVLFHNHIVLASTFGAAHNIGSFEPAQAQYLGFKENLRGFRIQRFAGRSNAYNNTELRVNLGELNLHLFKASFGVLGFHDVGRVWADGENSTTWHRGYGGGIWFAPLDKLVIAVTSTNSKEEKNLTIVNFGFQF